jgi:hypothetical protein
VRDDQHDEHDDEHHGALVGGSRRILRLPRPSTIVLAAAAEYIAFDGGLPLRGEAARAASLRVPFNL